ncbi:MAG: hypothetical protein ACTHMP_20810 [Thermomicrobiales bacterium]
MRGKGINYDTGFTNKGTSSREPFDPAVVRREIQIIRDDLHCTLLRVTGGDPARLDIAATLAAEAGLEVWFSPFTCDLTAAEMLALLADCAARAERLRQDGATIVLVAGAELSILNKGFLPGDTIGGRVGLLNDPQRLRELIAAVPAQINAFLAEAVTAIRAHFGGPITYAAMPFEGVDWTPFDFVSFDLYRSVEVADHFAAGVRTLVAQGKPVAITEFGCATYHGAAERGARAGFVIEWDDDTATPLRLDGDYTSDEAEQAAYLRDLLTIFDAEGVDTANVFTFAGYNLPHRSPPRADLDLASYGIVTVFEDHPGATYPDLHWQPKAAFFALAECYRG